jgi:hypothetical protein
MGCAIGRWYCPYFRIDRSMSRLRHRAFHAASPAPFPHRFDLGGRHFVVHFRIAPNLTKMRALQELASRRLAAADGLNLTASQTFSGGS